MLLLPLLWREAASFSLPKALVVCEAGVQKKGDPRGCCCRWGLVSLAKGVVGLVLVAPPRCTRVRGRGGRGVWWGEGAPAKARMQA
eukprot:448405-Pelagomonas_calceolata.AAC.2